MPPTLYDHLPAAGDFSSDELLERFLEYVEAQGMELYSSQESAILELYDDKNVILNTPTGSGKSLVAAAGHFKALAEGRRTVYTCPIKALVNEKWMALCREFGAPNVGLSTGDASINRDAPILCCTAEILANIALRDGAQAYVHEVVMDEFHYYADRERGAAWQIPILTLPRARFLLMSATLGDTRFFEEELTRRTGRPTATVSSRERPVPLSYSWSSSLLSKSLEDLVAEGKTPVYVVHFTQRDAARNAQSFTSLNVATKEEKAAIAREIVDVTFNSPYGPDIKRWVRQGIGIHHAGLLPKYRLLVEQLARKGLLKVICGTDTLGVGINVPIRTVLFTRLCKYDGEKTRILSARDFHQVSGRAGRKGYDEEGWVVVQAPEHVVENLQIDRKRARGKKKANKKKPPDRNFVNWDKQTMERLIASPPERLQSRFAVTHAMLLNVLSRNEDGCRALRTLIDECHDPDAMKPAHVKRAWQLFRSLLDRRIIEFIPPAPTGKKLRVNVELQDDFSLDQTLSLYLLDTLTILDATIPEYPYVLMTLVESILENPAVILRKQLDRIKTAKMAQMKAEGIAFEERIEKLDELEYPKPDREFIYGTFNDFADRHPWVGQEAIRPKSIVREMFETYSSFGDYVRTYGLKGSEGLLLRHINSVYRVLSQTVPDPDKTEEVREMEEYLRTMIRAVDSTLFDEWERMKDPAYRPADDEEGDVDMRPPGSEEVDITGDAKAFTAMIRARIFSFVGALSRGNYAGAAAALEQGVDAVGDQGEPAGESGSEERAAAWSAERLEQVMEGYWSEHEAIRLDPEARNLRHTHVTRSSDGRSWRVEQVLIDPAEDNDWEVAFTVDLAASRQRREPAMALVRVGAL
jgi:hypothetical protein